MNHPAAHTHDHEHTPDHENKPGHGHRHRPAGLTRVQATAIAGELAANRLAWIDAGNGIAGDMLLGALIDAGADAGAIAALLEGLVPGELHLEIAEVVRGGQRATKVEVIADEPNPPARHLSDVEALLRGATVPARTRELALACFRRLAEAEGRVHGVPATDVHFHEVGALDSIADVVGCCEAVRLLGIQRVVASPITVGAGHQQMAHGLMSIPPPAVAELLKGWPSQSGDDEQVGELATPTGVALVRVLAQRPGGLPQMTVAAVGTGAGTKELPNRSNTVRVFVSTGLDAPPAPPGQVIQVEANVDDLDPRLWPGVIDRLLEAGAVDAWLTAILMKKGRPAHTIHALCPPETQQAVCDAIFTNTSTIGVRFHAPAHRRVLARSWQQLEVAGQPIRMKVSSDEHGVRQVTPEFDDVARAARELGKPEREVLQLAYQAWAGRVNDD